MSIFRNENGKRTKKNVISPPMPAEMLLESYERRPNHAEFDRIGLVLEFRPGKDNIGVTVKVLSAGVHNP